MATTVEVTAATVAESVREAEYARLLQAPIDLDRSPRVKELAGESRAWFAQRGTPQLVVRRVRVARVSGGKVQVEAAGGVAATLACARLARPSVCSVWVVAASAGRALEREVAARWKASRPDEAFFLDRFGAAVAEHLVTVARSSVDRDHAPAGLRALAPTSPGNDGWQLADQGALAQLLDLTDDTEPAVLPSGALSPSASVLAAIGVVPEERAVERIPCASCSLASCDYRRPLEVTA